MAGNQKNYKALLIRNEARALIDEVKAAYAEKYGIELNYTQTITVLCRDFMNNLKKESDE